MTLTPRQRAAFTRANAACEVIGYGALHRVAYPVDPTHPEGPRAETAVSFEWQTAQAKRAEHVAYTALVLIGIDPLDAAKLTMDKTSPPFSRFVEALKRASEKGMRL